MLANVQKWGNSLALRIPRSVASEMGLVERSSVNMLMKDGKLEITPVDNPADELAQLLELVTPENCHGEVDTGKSVGGESW